MILTCPKKEQHVAALQDNLTYILSDSQNSDDDFRALGIMLLSGLSKPLLNTYLSVDDYLLFSVGMWKYDGKDKLASIGAFGHIFTASKKELKRRVEQNEDIKSLLERL